MNDLPSILKNHLESGKFRPGYILAGDCDHLRLLIRKIAAFLLNCEESLVNSHPDFFEQIFEIFTTKEMQEILHKIHMKPIVAEKRVFSLTFFSVSPEAELSLSKILEEPPPFCHFFFLSPPLKAAFQRLRSQLIEINPPSRFELNSQKRIFYEKFLKSGPVERLNLIKNISSDKKSSLEFLNELELLLEERLRKQRGGASPQLIASLEEIKTKREFLFEPAASPWLILEHFVLHLPKL